MPLQKGKRLAHPAGEDPRGCLASPRLAGSRNTKPGDAAESVDLGCACACACVRERERALERHRMQPCSGAGPALSSPLASPAVHGCALRVACFCSLVGCGRGRCRVRALRGMLSCTSHPALKARDRESGSWVIHAKGSGTSTAAVRAAAPQWKAHSEMITGP